MAGVGVSELGQEGEEEQDDLAPDPPVGAIRGCACQAPLRRSAGGSLFKEKVMGLTVHHLENSRSQRVLWLLEELGLAYEVRRYERNKKTMLAPPELRKVHPLGRVAVKKFQPMIDVHVDYVEAELGRYPWFAGDAFTAADVMMSYPLEVARSRAGISRSSHRRIFAWVETIQGRPAYQAALARGGPYAFG